MMDYKINQLRLHLVSQGVPNAEIEDILSSINSSIQDKLTSILSSGISSAAQKAEEIKARGFLGEISIKPSHLGFEITTDSGNMDFSTPEFPMLDRLLARGRTAKDGSTYRVVPIGKNSEQKQVVSKDIQSGMSSVASQKPSKSLTEMVGNMATAFGMGAQKVVQSKSENSQKPAEVVFRTASSKQDRTRSWVIPKREADLAPAISEINAMMASEIASAIDQAIQEHREEIENAIRDARDSRY
jgi:ElaB/YqjD/DUF883 family membrane-anchored ribosome-binding protein